MQTADKTKRNEGNKEMKKEKQAGRADDVA